MLERLRGLAGCLFVVAPDVVADAESTGRLFREWRDQLAGVPVAFVAQDGQRARSVPWDQFAALFIGGTTSYKLGPAAAELAADARARGKWVHMGRVNSYRRIAYARSIGCDSIDGGKWAIWRRRHLQNGLAAVSAGPQLEIFR